MIVEKLMNIQQELKAPKDQKNTFGNYKYRSCEDILEAVKPILKKYEVALVLEDDMVQIGDRYYIKAVATLYDTKKSEEDKVDYISNKAYARESETKKGMDDSQITGTASSYARKYALNGLFCIDDTKDADTDEYYKQEHKDDENKKITKVQAEALINLIKNKALDKNDEYLNIYKKYGYTKTSDIKEKDYIKIVNEIHEEK